MNIKRKPLMAWQDYLDNKIGKPAWYGILDNRYICEVQRDAPYEGTLCIFDHNDGNSLIHESKVGISYDALFGPDVQDAYDWELESIKIVDEIATRS